MQAEGRRFDPGTLHSLCRADFALSTRKSALFESPPCCPHDSARRHIGPFPHGLATVRPVGTVSFQPHRNKDTSPVTCASQGPRTLAPKRTLGHTFVLRWQSHCSGYDVAVMRMLQSARRVWNDARQEMTGRWSLRAGCLDVVRGSGLRWIASGSSALVLGAVVASAGESEASRLRLHGGSTQCAPGSVSAVIAGKHRCLKAGQTCKRSLDKQYHRYKFHCHSGRLARMKAAPPPPPAPPLRCPGSGSTSAATASTSSASEPALRL